MRTQVLSATAAFICLTSAAHAEDQGFYLGLSLGEATQEFSIDGDDIGEGTFDGADTAVKLLAGYEFNRYFAVEAGYADTGTQRDDLNGLDVRLSAEGFHAALLAKLPLGRGIAPYAKLGYVVYDSKATLSAEGDSISGSENEDDPLYGLGCEFALGRRLKLRAEYEYIDVAGSDFDIVSLVATFHF
jgi:OmpA-OmpF porin, OOP family